MFKVARAEKVRSNASIEEKYSMIDASISLATDKHCSMMAALVASLGGSKPALSTKQALSFSISPQQSSCLLRSSRIVKAMGLRL